jgi:hypothetical protein
VRAVPLELRQHMFAEVGGRARPDMEPPVFAVAGRMIRSSEGKEFHLCLALVAVRHSGHQPVRGVRVGRVRGRARGCEQIMRKETLGLREVEQGAP